MSATHPARLKLPPVLTQILWSVSHPLVLHELACKVFPHGLASTGTLVLSRARLSCHQGSLPFHIISFCLFRLLPLHAMHPITSSVHDVGLHSSLQALQKQP